VELGLHLPVAGDKASPEVILRVAGMSEDMGLASVWTSDTLLRPTRQPVDFGGGISIHMPPEGASQFEPLETLAFVAAKTSRIRLGTSTIGVLFQNPAALARRLATLDQLSHGRLIAGLGQGWIPEAFAVAGVSPRRRGAGFEEHVTAMRAVWGADPVRFNGRFYQIPESQIGPKPVLPAGPSMVLAAASPAAAERAGRMGIGINPVLQTWDYLELLVATFRTAATAAGHDASRLPVIVRVNGSITKQAATDGPPLTGTAKQVAQGLERLEAFGVHHVFWVMFDTEPDQQLASMRQLLTLVRRS
jgi:probable F420-dependent oxidoreductase